VYVEYTWPAGSLEVNILA